MANFFKAQVKAKPTGQIIALDIEKLDNNCTGVAYHNRKPVFVSGAIVGEKIKAKVLQAKSKYSIAQLVDVMKPSSHRIKARCHHFLKCGGCDIQHIDPTQHEQIKMSQVVEYFSRQGISEELPWQAPIFNHAYGYRRKARIGVQYTKSGQAIVGFRKKATNELIPIKHCDVLDDRISNVFVPLRQLISQLSQHKPIGHVEVIVTSMVTLVVRQLVPLNNQDKCHWLNYAQQQDCQVLFDDGKQITNLHSETLTPLSYPLFDGTHITFNANDFIQVNADVNNKMIAQAIDWLALSNNDNVLDLFCGLGNFSLPIAKKVNSVVGVEGMQSMVSQASFNAENNRIANCHFYQANLNAPWDTSTWQQNTFNKVILDPARAGALEALPQVISLNISTILYVSCDASTLARDSKLLLSHGYSIKKIAIMDMFSQTKHVETMVLFSLNVD